MVQSTNPAGISNNLWLNNSIYIAKLSLKGNAEGWWKSNQHQHAKALLARVCYILSLPLEYQCHNGFMPQLIFDLLKAAIDYKD